MLLILSAIAESLLTGAAGEEAVAGPDWVGDGPLRTSAASSAALDAHRGQLPPHAQR
jgi:hypothetical protein